MLRTLEDRLLPETAIKLTGELDSVFYLRLHLRMLRMLNYVNNVPFFGNERWSMATTLPLFGNETLSLLCESYSASDEDNEQLHVSFQLRRSSCAESAYEGPRLAGELEEWFVCESCLLVHHWTALSKVFITLSFFLSFHIYSQIHIIYDVPVLNINFVFLHYLKLF